MIEAIYPTPIFVTKADPKTLAPIQKEIEAIEEVLIFSSGALQNQWGEDHLQISDSSGNSNIVKKYNLIKLREYIKLCTDQYTHSVSHQPLPCDIHQSWMTRSGKGGVGAIHAHGQFDISGVYYYKTNGKDGAIRFHNPNLGFEASKVWLKNSVARLQPEVGTLVLFPGWLDHSVEVNNTDDYRMSLAFNMTIDRSYLFRD